MGPPDLSRGREPGGELPRPYTLNPYNVLRGWHPFPPSVSSPLVPYTCSWHPDMMMNSPHPCHTDPTVSTHYDAPSLLIRPSPRSWPRTVRQRLLHANATKPSGEGDVIKKAVGLARFLVVDPVLELGKTPRPAPLLRPLPCCNTSGWCPTPPSPRRVVL